MLLSSYPKEWGRDSLAASWELGRQGWDRGVRQVHAKGGSTGWILPRGPRAQSGPRGVLLMLLAPHLRMSPMPSHACACGSRMSFGVTAGFPLQTLPPFLSSDKEHCLCPA